MIADLIHGVVCRMTGKKCTPERPSSKDLRAEMQTRARKVEAETTIMRMKRTDRASVFDELIDDVTGNHAGVGGSRG